MSSRIVYRVLKYELDDLPEEEADEAALQAARLSNTREADDERFVVAPSGGSIQDGAVADNLS